MADLLDASVWLPLSAAGHVHHGRARDYWANQSGDQIAFCRVTVLALLRHLTNRRIMGPDVQTAEQAWGIYERWREVPDVLHLSEPDGVDAQLAEWSETLKLESGHWTDAYLAAVAVSGGHRLVTFDADFKRYPNLEFLHLEK
ncbi:MAG TPA: TA system VapC family ribonuclease toxin [Gemmatimonadales bacterium]